MTDQIEFAAAALAQAEQGVHDAQAIEDGARCELSDVEAKLAAVTARKSNIRADLAAGTLSEAQAGGLFQIASADEVDLAEIRHTAADQLEAAVAATQNAQAARNLAIGALRQAEIRVQFDTLSGHAARLELELTNAVAELHALGRALGLPQSLSAAWRPSTPLRSAIILGIPPAKVTP